MRDEWKTGLFPTALDDVQAAALDPATPQTMAPSYRLAFRDHDFLLTDELRAVRLLLEFEKPELILNERGVEHTIVFFGGARIQEPAVAQARVAEAEAAARQAPTDAALGVAVTRARQLVANSGYYEEARTLAGLISHASMTLQRGSCVVATGGGPGIMEAANRGAAEAGAQSIGYNIVLPFEQHPNEYVTPELCFLFHYFAIRKMHFLKRARALVVFPGGYGTMDELFETLTLIQTKKIKPMPVLIFGKDFWDRVVNLQVLVEEGMIAPADVALFRFVDTAEEAWTHIATAILGHCPPADVLATG
jgi:uncharacterized protein (TIGR00730 family)